MKNNWTAVVIGFLSLIFGETTIQQHYLHLDLEPGTHRLVARDKIEISTTESAWEFYLSANLTIQSVKVGDKQREFEEIQITRADLADSHVKKYRVRKRFMESAEKLLDIVYTGQFYQDVQEASFSREKIAMEVNGTITEDGIFLSPSAVYYPVSDESLTQFDTVIKLPGGWDVVSEGGIISSEKNTDYTEVHFKTTHSLDGVYITAAQWIVQKEKVGDIDFYTYFFAEDTSLARDYLAMSIDYVKMYSEMLSPYPYTKFAVVENFFPTGYGMPSYTVLGRSVVNLPFIVYTSLGHEVLHNWWGNSVFVGNGGNWCEGLTAYMADYYYKLQKSEKEARRYRKDILKDYTVYVTPENDFSPSEFINRTDMVTRTIGYGKIAMIFHMLEEHLGKEKFLSALRLIIRQHQFTSTDFSDFISAFEQVSGEDLQGFEKSWFDESGNPKLVLKVDSGKFYLDQENKAKPMWVPVRYTYTSGEIKETLVFTNSGSVELMLPGDGLVSKIEVDPDFDIMRTLDESEMDATIRHILSAEERVFVVPEKTEEWLALANSYNDYLNDGHELDLYTQDEAIPELPVVYLGIITDGVSDLVEGKTLRINGDTYDANTHSFVWAFKQDNGQYALDLYSENSKELIPLARKIPHYGKYGYLVFEHGQNILKGNHESDHSPLVWRR
ncbi:MAG: M1 family metallopeptidase [FCB group bacterium]|nr:M1 family metallopeptidase [FCB group bacterium]